MTLEAEVLALGERLRNTEPASRPRIAEADGALTRFLAAIGIDPLAVRWCPGGAEGLLEAARGERHPGFEEAMTRATSGSRFDHVPAQGTPLEWAVDRKGRAGQRRVCPLPSAFPGRVGWALESVLLRAAASVEPLWVHPSWKPAPAVERPPSTADGDREKREQMLATPHHARSSPRQLAHSFLSDAAYVIFGRALVGAPPRPPSLDAVEPLIDAHAAGLWRFWVLADEVIAVPFPEVRAPGDRLHSEDGPAIRWPDGSCYWFWHGVQVPREVIEDPESLTAERIRSEPNVEIRRLMIDRFGSERFMRESEARLVHADEYGVLWRLDLPGDQPLVMVEVVNATPEPDGSVRQYLLRVPPNSRTARGAVAWTFGEDEQSYDPEVET